MSDFDNSGWDLFGGDAAEKAIADLAEIVEALRAEFGDDDDEGEE